MEEEKEIKTGGGSYFRLFDRDFSFMFTLPYIGHVLESGRSIIIIKS